MSGRDGTTDLPQAVTGGWCAAHGDTPDAGCRDCRRAWPAPAGSAAEPAKSLPTRRGRKRLDDGPRTISGKRPVAGGPGSERRAGSGETPIPADEREAVRRHLMACVTLDAGTGCWLWTAGKSAGYGRLLVGRTTRYAHRVMYELTTGQPLAGVFLDHLCCTPACINPAHLEPVTNAENMRRAAERRPTCRRGHPRTPENMIGGYRKCRACDDIMRAARKARRGVPRG